MSGPWVPVLVLAAIMAAGLVLSPPDRFDPPWLLPPLNLVFQTIVPLIAATIAVVGYRRTGVGSVLALGAGMLATGVGCGVLPALLIVSAHQEDGVALHNASAAIAASAHFVAALGGISGVTLGPSRGRHVILAYGSIIVAVALVLVGTVSGVIPPYWQDGPTPIRVATLSAGALLFGMSAFAWWQTAMRDRSIRFLNWYAPALALFALGLAVMVGNGVLGGLLSWLGRLGQYAGAIYMLIAVAPEAVPGRRRDGERVLGVALLQAALPFRPLVESTSDAVIALGRSGRVLYWNEAAARMFGYEAAEAFDRDPVELLLPFDGPEPTRAALQRLFRAFVGPGSDRRLEARLADRRGRSFSAEIRSFGSAEDPRLAVVVISDITARVRSREELERRVEARTRELASANVELARTNADLERANLAKDEFLGLVSHELKTPITSIVAASALLGRAGGGRHELVKDIGAEAARLGGIVDNLLALARLDSGNATEPEPLPLERLVQAAAAASQRQYPGRDVEVSAEHGVIVEGNEDQLMMVLRNYIGNALKYSPLHEPVEILLRQEDGHARLTVLDRGPGIPAGEEAALFEPFRRGERTAAIAGIGIGLTVCRRLIEAHGGSVGAASRHDGPGAIFWFELPLSAAAAADGEEPQAPPPATAIAGTIAGTGR